jgi:hypothetical protein
MYTSSGRISIDDEKRESSDRKLSRCHTSADAAFWELLDQIERMRDGIEQFGTPASSPFLVPPNGFGEF